MKYFPNKDVEKKWIKTILKQISNKMVKRLLTGDIPENWSTVELTWYISYLAGLYAIGGNNLIDNRNKIDRKKFNAFKERIKTI